MILGNMFGWMYNAAKENTKMVMTFKLQKTTQTFSRWKMVSFFLQSHHAHPLTLATLMENLT